MGQRKNKIIIRRQLFAALYFTSALCILSSLLCTLHNRKPYFIISLWNFAFRVSGTYLVLSHRRPRLMAVVGTNDHVWPCALYGQILLRRCPFSYIAFLIARPDRICHHKTERTEAHCWIYLNRLFKKIVQKCLA